MRFSTAQMMLQKSYAEALTRRGVEDPVAWALYQTWKAADVDRQKQAAKARKTEERHVKRD